MKPSEPRAPITKEERSFLNKFHQLSPDRQEFIKLVITVMRDVEDQPNDAALFSHWLKSEPHRDRPVADVMRVLRTGRWRREAAKLRTTRVLRAMPKAGTR